MHWPIRHMALGLGLALVGSAQSPPETSPGHTCAQMEQFLRKGKVGTMREIPKGTTLPKRATLEYEDEKHDASIQAVDVTKPFQDTEHGAEMNFRDSWKYNVAGYELAKMLELNMVPPYIERNAGGQAASFSWWIDGTMMESDRVRKKIEPPDAASWNKQMHAVRLFHELIYDSDPNLTNLLITKGWQIWMIDFTRAFRMMKDVANPKSLLQCDRKLLARIRGLNKSMVKAKLSRWLTGPEIDGLVARAAKIAEHFDREIAAKGEAAVLYDLPRTSQACGSGL
ncbi:MAG: hypothetical protein HYX25_07865 [Candidatus Solibacter usitatus]|nr:hypothetical protein [Candidatus Solibacter usitatus]